MSAEFRFMHSNHTASNLPLADDGYQLTIRLMKKKDSLLSEEIKIDQEKNMTLMWDLALLSILANTGSWRSPREIIKSLVTRLQVT